MDGSHKHNIEQKMTEKIENKEHLFIFYMQIKTEKRKSMVLEVRRVVIWEGSQRLGKSIKETSKVLIFLT